LSYTRIGVVILAFINNDVCRGIILQ